MRTAKQIANIRDVLVMSLGPFGLLMTDEAINNYADRLQETIDNQAYIYWEIRVKTKENANLQWEQIEPEPKLPYGTKKQMIIKANSLLEKYVGIVSLCISEVAGYGHFFVIERKDNEPCVVD